MPWCTLSTRITKAWQTILYSWWVFIWQEGFPYHSSTDTVAYRNLSLCFIPSLYIAICMSAHSCAASLLHRRSRGPAFKSDLSFRIPIEAHKKAVYLHTWKRHIVCISHMFVCQRKFPHRQMWHCKRDRSREVMLIAWVQLHFMLCCMLMAEISPAGFPCSRNWHITNCARPRKDLGRQYGAEYGQLQLQACDQQIQWASLPVPHQDSREICPSYQASLCAQCLWLGLAKLAVASSWTCLELS